MTKPVIVKAKSTEEGAEWLDEGTPRPIKPVKFSGLALSVECDLQAGTFNNFRIATLKLDNGILVDKKLSEPYASFEAIARMEIAVNKAVLSLNFEYEDGKAWKKVIE